MADVDPEILAEARRVMEARLLVEIEKRLRRKAGEAEGDCVQAWFEGSGTVKATTDVEFDVEEEGSTIGGHINDLQSEQLKQGWSIVIPKTTIYDTKKEVCGSPSDTRTSETLQISMTYKEDQVLFSGFQHGNHRDTVRSKGNSVVNVEAAITFTIRAWSCYTAMLFKPGQEVAVAFRPRETRPGKGAIALARKGGPRKKGRTSRDA